jgi:hypothetical protein
MSYCTVGDVCSAFPRFVRGQSGSISDSQIESWCEDASTLIHAGFYQRGLDTDSLSHPLVSNPSQATPVTDQPQVLRELSVPYPIWKLGSAIWATLTPTEQALARSNYDLWAKTLKKIGDGVYDKLFYLYARTVDIQPAFAGVGGAETDRSPQVVPPDNRAFTKELIW